MCKYFYLKISYNDFSQNSNQVHSVCVTDSIVIYLHNTAETKSVLCTCAHWLVSLSTWLNWQYFETCCIVLLIFFSQKKPQKQSAHKTMLNLHNLTINQANGLQCQKMKSSHRHIIIYEITNSISFGRVSTHRTDLYQSYGSLTNLSRRSLELNILNAIILGEQEICTLWLGS